MKTKLMRIENVSPCLIVKRLNRFTVEIIVQKKLERAHINNSGRLTECIIKDREACCLRNPKNNGKTKYRVFAIRENNSSILIDTRMQTLSFELAVEKGLLPWMNICSLKGRNVKVGASLVDYLFDCNGKEHWLELKSAALRADSRYALYPDCPTIRGRKHLKDLTNLSSRGSSATVVFVAALSGVDAFRPNPNGDLQIPRLLQKALKAGVAIRAISVCYEPETSTVYLDNPDLKVELNY